MSWRTCLFARPAGVGGRPSTASPSGCGRDPFRPVVPWSTGDQEPARFKPDFQIETTADGFVFQADLAGIKENEVDIAVTGNRLTISGHIYDTRAGAFAGFTRVFTLPEGNDGNDKVRAALDRGVLTVRWSNGSTMRRKQRPCRATTRWRAGNRKAGRRETGRRSRGRGPSRSADDHAPQSGAAPPRLESQEGDSG